MDFVQKVTNKKSKQDRIPAIVRKGNKLRKLQVPSAISIYPFQSGQLLFDHEI